MRPISTYPITINNLSIILKVRVDNLFRSTSMSCTTNPTIKYFIFMNTMIHMAIRNRFIHKFTMTIWVMGIRVAGMGFISTSPITTNSFYHIKIGRVDGIFIPRSTSSNINSYITSSVNIITTYISPTITIIKTNITLLFFMNIFICTTRRNCEVNNIPLSTGLWE